MKAIKEMIENWRKRNEEERERMIREHIQVEEINGRLWITCSGQGIEKLEGDVSVCMESVRRYRELAVMAYQGRRAEI